MDIKNLVSNASQLSVEIVDIRKKEDNRRKNSKENFNFFSAILSGKNNKQHIEKYHSNFIAYLLNPNGSHDFGTLFLKYFFDELKNPPFSVQNFPNENTLSLEREKMTSNGRFIDISLGYKQEWIVFIENKIRSGEQEDQIKDYCEFAKGFKNSIPIYLTLKGENAPSIEQCPDLKSKVVCLSYKEIIRWLSTCLEDETIKEFPTVVGCLKQYIIIVKALLNTMSEETKTIIEYLKQNKDKAQLYIKNQRALNDGILYTIKEIRNTFFHDLESEIIKRKKENNIPKSLTINIYQGDYLYSGADNSWGLGFQIKNNNNEFEYGGDGFGGSGDGIRIKGINAHTEEGIDETNALLFGFYENPEEWRNTVLETSDYIMSVVLNKVIPKYLNNKVV